MSRVAAVETIIQATQWLFSSPKTCTGRFNNHIYEIEWSARTRILRPGSRGIYFGYRETYHPDGALRESTRVKLVNHADSKSFRDCVPVTSARASTDPALGFGEKLGINFYVLSRLAPAKLSRIAYNARLILEEYKQV